MAKRKREREKRKEYGFCESVYNVEKSFFMK